MKLKIFFLVISLLVISETIAGGTIIYKRAAEILNTGIKKVAESKSQLSSSTEYIAAGCAAYMALAGLYTLPFSSLTIPTLGFPLVSVAVSHSSYAPKAIIGGLAVSVAVSNVAAGLYMLSQIRYQ